MTGLGPQQMTRRTEQRCMTSTVRRERPNRTLIFTRRQLEAALGRVRRALQHLSTTPVSRSGVTDRHDSPAVSTLLSGNEESAEIGASRWFIHVYGLAA